MIDHRLINGRAVRDRILATVAERVAAASAKHRIGRLVSVSIGENKAAAVKNAAENKAEAVKNSASNATENKTK